MGADNSPIYDDMMRFKPEGLTPNGWAMKAGVSRTVWADMRRHGNPSRRTLEKLLAAAGSSLMEFEALRVGSAPAELRMAAAGVSDRALVWRPAQLPPLPVLGVVAAGDWGEPNARIELVELRTGEVIDRLPRPIRLSEDSLAYAITIVGNSMWPRFRMGRRIAVSPMAPVTTGDDVLVKLKSTEGENASGRESVGVLIKELVRTAPNGIELRQFNPDVTFQVPSSKIMAVEKVVGELI
jgi:SOS-response transcriptional repressor LexA